MTEDEDERLSMIQTRWTLIGQAHGEAASQQARSDLLIRYYDPITKYVIAILRNNGVHASQIDDVAVDFCNRFSMKFLEGAFHRASPQKGRFRNYVKTAIKHEIWKYLKSERNVACSLADDIAQMPTPDESMDDDWRGVILEQALGRLQDEFPRYHAFLQLRRELSEASSQELSEKYFLETGEEVSKANVRKLIEKARKKLSSFIFADVLNSIEAPSRDKVLAELKALRLTKYCHHLLDEAWPA